MKVTVILSLLLLGGVSAVSPRKPNAVINNKGKATTSLPKKKASTITDRELQKIFDAKVKQYQAGIPPPPTNVGSGATISNEVFNLVKGIVGVGVLSLPAGIAAFGSAPSALVPALVLISIIGLLSAYGFALIGKVCAYTGARSYREAWESSVGPTTAWIPAWSATLKTLLACLAYSMVLADTFTVLLPVAEEARNKVLVGVTTLVLLPLCWMKDLKSLAPFSLLGVMGMAVRMMPFLYKTTLFDPYSGDDDDKENHSGLFHSFSQTHFHPAVALSFVLAIVYRPRNDGPIFRWKL